MGAHWGRPTRDPWQVISTGVQWWTAAGTELRSRRWGAVVGNGGNWAMVGEGGGGGGGWVGGFAGGE